SGGSSAGLSEPLCLVTTGADRDHPDIEDPGPLRVLGRRHGRGLDRARGKPAGRALVTGARGPRHIRLDPVGLLAALFAQESNPDTPEPDRRTGLLTAGRCGFPRIG